MIDVNSTQNENRKRNLRSTYVREPQFGFVLGAGVTVQSGVPMYDELALRLLEEASKQGKLSIAEDWVQSFVQRQRELLTEGDRKTVPPEEVVLFVRTHLKGNEDLLRKLIKKVLYKEAQVGRIVKREAFEKNKTLNAILTFCAARPKTVLAPASDPRSSKKEYDIETNIKVGGLLTTNYDNLVEGAFHTKYRRNLLKPVGRPASREFERNRRLIPVYHVHGYIGYRGPESADDEMKTPEIVIAEDDYFQAFYDPLGFGNYIAMSFLRRFPCLFIGSALTDKNLRRFLFHLTKDTGITAPHQRKFAILPTFGAPEEELADEILLSYGVETIWIGDFGVSGNRRGQGPAMGQVQGCANPLPLNLAGSEEDYVKNHGKSRRADFGEIEDILRGMYTAVSGVTKADWEYVANYRWPHEKITS